MKLIALLILLGIILISITVSLLTTPVGASTIVCNPVLVPHIAPSKRIIRA
jgi:hypothetical protein